jgi:hypothetical protein
MRVLTIHLLGLLFAGVLVPGMATSDEEAPDTEQLIRDLEEFLEADKSLDQRKRGEPSKRHCLSRMTFIH